MDLVEIVRLAATFALVVYSIILHEIAHGYAALKFGDETALRMDRITLNPISHIDEVGTLLLPAIQIFSFHTIYIGYAKPVPVNPNNLEPRVGGEIVVSIAGVFVNFSIALALSIVMGFPLLSRHSEAFRILHNAAFANIALGVFNLVPIPPLDGSHVAKYLLPRDLREPYERLGFMGIFILLFLNYHGFLDPITSGPIGFIADFLMHNVTNRLRGLS